jgi:TonB family protein
VSSRAPWRWLGVVLLTLAVTWLVVQPLPASSQQQTEELTRKVKTKVQPVYPDLARRMNISGTVKVAVVVAPNGSVKSTRLVGGHPLLVNAAMDALKRWRFEAAADETTGIVEVKFDSPAQ